MPGTRREFLLTAMSMLGSAALTRFCADDVQIDVLPAEPIGPVTGALYGHLIEHLGGVIYDGVWFNGDLRQALVDDLKVLTPGVIRWPGGCFADSYDWKDGTGAPATRPRRGNFWGGYESNAFGTPEFMRFCRAVGAEPYMAVNARGRTAQDWTEWVDYCNAPPGTTMLADRRAADGSREPYHVRYWGVGNEPWGCGGQLTPEEYTEEYRRFSAGVPSFPGTADARLIAAGPSDRDESWTRRFLESLVAGRGQPPYGLSVHSYFFLDHDLSFTAKDWDTAMAKPRDVATLLELHAALIRAAKMPIKLVLDEWGDWYRTPDQGTTNPAHRFEGIPTMRDALVTTLMFDVFHAHADVLAMAVVAQLVNCIHSLFLTDGPKCVRTPIYHAFALYQPHIGGTAVRTVTERLSASATLHDKRIVLTVTNPSIDRPVSATVRIRGSRFHAVDMMTLRHDDPHAHNTFATPDNVALQPLTVGSKRLTLPPASATRITYALDA